MPSLFPENTDQTTGSVFPTEQNNTPFSERQGNMFSMSAALARQNLSNEPVDIGTEFDTSKQQLQNGQEQNIRENIQSLEQQNTGASLKAEFNDAVVTGNPTKAEQVVELAKQHLNNPPHQDAVEFNALDSFRQDTNQADGELLDTKQALIASASLVNQVEDKRVQSGGVIDTITNKYKQLQQDALTHGNTLKEDVVKGLASGIPAAVNGFADQINKALPASYWKMLSDNPEQFKAEVLKQSEANVNSISEFANIGESGKVAESFTKFATGMSAVLALLPEVAGSAGLAGLRVITAGALGDAAVFDGMDSAVKQITDSFPSTKNVITNYLGDRTEGNFWDNKLKQTLESAGFNTLGEGIFNGAIKMFKGAKQLVQAKNALEPLKEIANDPISTATELGDRQAAATMTQQKMTGSTDLSPLVDQVVDTNKAVESATPSIMKTPLDVKPEVGISGDVNTQFNISQAQEQIKQLNSSLYQTNRLSDEELLSAVSTTKERMVGLYGEKGITDIVVNKNNDLNTVDVIIGKKEGGGFKTEAIAKRSAIDLNADVIKLPNGEWFIKKTHAVRESGFVDQFNLDAVNKIIANPISQATLHPANYLPNNILEDIGVPYNAKNVIKKEFVNPLLNQYSKGVSKEEFTSINNIAAMGRDSQVDTNGVITTGKWFNKEEFDAHYATESGKDSNDKVWNSYKAFRDINDLQYAIDNHNEFIRKARIGYEEFNSNHPDFNFKGNVLVKDTLDALDTNHVYLPEEGKLYKPSEITKIEKENKFKDYKVIQLENDVELGNGIVAKHVLMNKADFNTSILDYQQVNYRPGGRVVYASKYFSKQARIDKLPDGTVVNRNPLTHYTDSSRRVLSEHTAKLENARNAYNSAFENKIYKPIESLKEDGTWNYSKTGKYLTVDEADAIVSQTSIGHTDNFNKLVESGSIRQDTPFEVRGDKELPLAYNNSSVSYIDDNHSGQSSWMLANKRTKFRQRGDRLLNPQEEAAQVLSPQEQIKQSVAQIVNSGLSGNYYARVSEQFAATLRAHEFLKPELRDASSAKIFMLGEDAMKPPINGTRDKDFQATKAILKSIQTGMGYKSTEAKIIDGQLKNFAEWWDKQGLKWFGKETVPNLSTINPINKINTFMYHTNFGLFNTMQFIVQGGSGYLSTALQSPLRGTQALFSSILHSAHFLSDETGEALVKNTKLLNLLGFDSKESYLELINSMKKSGYIDVTGSHIDLARQKSFTGKKGVTFDLLDKAFEAGSVPVRSGEALNQMIGYQVAFQRFKDKFPELTTDSSSATGWIIREADKILFDMKSATRRQLNQGILQFPLKYKNFMTNVAESMTIGQKFTAKEKALFWAGTVGMFGPPTGPMMDSVLQSMGVNDPKTRERINGGILNGLVDLASSDELHIDLSSQFSPTGALSDMYTQLASSDTKFWPMVGGALATKVLQFGDKAGKSIHLLESMDGKSLPNDFRLTQEALSEIAKITSSWNNYTRGQLALDTGKIASNTGVPIVDGINNMTAKMMMLGLQNRDLNKFYQITMPTYQDIQKDIKQKADAISYFRSEAMRQDINSKGGMAKFNMYNDVSRYIGSNEPNFIQIQQQANSTFKQMFISKQTKTEQKLQQLKRP